MSKWTNQKEKLGFIQRQVCFGLLYQNVGDSNAATLALSVLNAHIAEDEDETVRNIVFIALTTTNIEERSVALAGLSDVSSKNSKIAEAAFFYFVDNSETFYKSNSLALATCIHGLAKYSRKDALSRIALYTNNPNKYLSCVARDAVKCLNGANEK